MPRDGVYKSIITMLALTTLFGLVGGPAWVQQFIVAILVIGSAIIWFTRNSRSAPGDDEYPYGSQPTQAKTKYQ